MKKVILTLSLILAIACVFTACDLLPNGTNKDCEHVWETVTTNPTCTSKGCEIKTCTVCKEIVEIEIEKLEHDYATTYMIDDNFHWYKCNYCAATNGKELHTLDGEGACMVCDLPVSSTPGVIYDLSDDKSYAMVVEYEGTATKVKIVEEYNGVPVKSIGNWAFSHCSDLTSVVIPDSVTSIGDGAFAHCSGLTSVVIPDSVTSIGHDAFAECSSLTSVVIPNRVTSIGNYAFYGCHPSLYKEYEFGKYVGSKDNPYFALVETTNNDISTFTIHEDTKLIAGGAFRYCTNLTSIVIPDSITSIGEGAFYDCTSLTSVVIPESVTDIGYGVFVSCINLLKITVNADNDYYSSIDGNLYSKDATILIQYAIGKTDLEFCIPNSVTNIGDHAFESCSSLTSVVIPDSVTSIGNYAFYNCDSLTSVVIPNNVISIGDQAFRKCSSLTSVVIPDSVTSIGVLAFYECSNLTDVYYTGSEEEWAKIYSSNSSLTNVTIHYNYIPED